MSSEAHMTLFSLFALSLSILSCTQSGMHKRVGPAPTYLASTSEQEIERGRYLANHVAPCMTCHSSRDSEIFAGPVVPGTLGQGGETWAADKGFPGYLTAANITPAAVGSWTDGELLQSITAGVHRDGYALFPIMPYTVYGQMTELDAKTIVSYLRTIQPIETEAYRRELEFPLTKVVNKMPQKPQWAESQGETAIERGQYLSKVAGCEHCHTPLKGKTIDQQNLFSGGQEFPMSMGIAIAPNITADEGNGIGYWSKTDFINKFRAYQTDAAKSREAGPSAPNSPMPWFAYADMTDEDLSNIWAYLQSVPTHSNKVETRWKRR